MTGAEVAPATFLVLFDLHVWVAESYTFNFVAILYINDGLLFAIRWLTPAYASGFVERNFASFILSHYFL